MARAFLHVFVGLAVLLGVLALHVADQDQPQQEEVVLALVVEAGKVECVYQPMTNPKHVALEVAYQVTQGGSHDINFSAKSPQGVVVVSESAKTYGSHKIDVMQAHNGHGDYALCFDNSFAYEKKHVFFELFLMDKEGNYLNNYDIATFTRVQQQSLDLQVGNFDRITKKVKNNMNEVERLQSQLRAIESRDRSLMEDNFEHVNFWGVVHSVVMLTVFAVQVFMVRSLFIEDSKVGRFIRKGRFND